MSKLTPSWLAVTPALFVDTRRNHVLLGSASVHGAGC